MSSDIQELKEKAQFFSIVAYGIHSMFDRWLNRKMLSKFDLKSMFMYEYFTLKPIISSEEIDTQKGFAPFLLRIINQKRFLKKIESIPEISSWNQIGSVISNFSNLKDFWHGKTGINLADIRSTKVMNRVFEKWRSRGPEKTEGGEGYSFELEYDKETNLAMGNFCFPLDYLKNNYLDFIGAIDDEETKNFAFQEYLTTILPWLYCNDIKNLNMAAFSISSSCLFFGEVLIFYPDKDKLAYPEGIFRHHEIVKVIKDIITMVYVPVLFLFENCWSEQVLSSKELKTGTLNWDNYNCFLYEKLAREGLPMEQAFHALWQGRKNIYDTYSPKEEAQEKIEESLQFGKYIIASPKLVQEIGQIAVPREPLLNKRSYLPTFLVIGDPGSGKDTMAKIVQLFFPDYSFGKRYTINMAALKPDFLSVPLMTGGEMQLVETKKDNGQHSVERQVKGIFSKIWEDFCHEYGIGKENKDERLKQLGELGVFPVVILDELNSLDIDAQGSLLRILEQAELQPLGSIDGTQVNFLVVGVVNEPEGILTLQEPLQKFIQDSSFWGVLLGRYMYEQFRNIRRLREDLYHRLVREGKVNMRQLESRREDIPILFSVFVKSELDGLKWTDLWIDIDVFETLIDRRITWPGNFRQLQSIAKKTVSIARIKRKENQQVLKKIRKKKQPEGVFRISAEHILQVLKEYEFEEKLELPEL
jgi:hypothetical protein